MSPYLRCEIGISTRRATASVYP